MITLTNCECTLSGYKSIDLHQNEQIFQSNQHFDLHHHAALERKLEVSKERNMLRIRREKLKLVHLQTMFAFNCQRWRK